ncbi:MAG: Maf family protein [Verrucomicrobiota bacterium]
MNLPPLILASASPRRAELLRQLEVDFTVLPAGSPEADSEHLTPHEICQLNAYRKARTVSKKHPDALVLGADTEVCLGATIFGKPRTLKDAEEMLARLQGRTHEVVTGVCLIHLRSHKQKLFAVSTLVTFRQLTEQQIREYLTAINPLDKAGAYAIQDKGDKLVEELQGSFTNVVGLPMERLTEEFEKWPGTAKGQSAAG